MKITTISELIFTILVRFLLIGIVDSQTENVTGNHLSRLIGKLLDPNVYKTNVCPWNGTVDGLNQPLTINIKFLLIRIIDFDEKLEMITAIGRVMEVWQDNRLSWNPRDYGNITSISLRVEDVWKPDTVVTSLTIQNEEDKSEKTHVAVRTICPPQPQQNLSKKVDCHAEVILDYTTLIQQLCHVDITYFPFDLQTCTPFVGPKASDVTNLIYRNADGEQLYLSPRLLNGGGEWSFRHGRAYDVDTVGWLSFEAGQWSGVKFEIVIERRCLYFVINLVIPTIVICILNIIGLFANVHVDEGETEAATMGLTTMLALGLLLLTISEQTPKGTETISLFGIFFLLMIIQTAVATIMSVWLKNRHRRERIASLLHRWFPITENRKSAVWKQSDQHVHGIFRFEPICMLLHFLFITIVTITVLGIGYAHKNKSV